MYALVVTVSIDPSRQEEAQANLTSQVVPMVKQSPGVKGGYWLAPDDSGTGTSVVLFDTKEEAEAMVPMVAEEPGPGVRRTGVTVREVVASF